MATFKINLPTRQEAGSVFAVIVFLIFSWVMVTFFYRLTYWALYLEVTSLLGILAFGMVNALLESLFTFSLLLLITALLPSKYFKDHFEFQGTLTSLLFLIGIMIINYFQSSPSVLPRLVPDKSLFTFLGIVFAIFFLNALLLHSSRISQWITSMARRFIPFTYLYIPLSLISFLYLIILYLP